MENNIGKFFPKLFSIGQGKKHICYFPWVGKKTIYIYIFIFPETWGNEYVVKKVMNHTFFYNALLIAQVPKMYMQMHKIKGGILWKMKGVRGRHFFCR